MCRILVATKSSENSCQQKKIVRITGKFFAHRHRYIKTHAKVKGKNVKNRKIESSKRKCLQFDQYYWQLHLIKSTIRKKSQARYQRPDDSRLWLSHHNVSDVIDLYFGIPEKKKLDFGTIFLLFVSRYVCVCVCTIETGV